MGGGERRWKRREGEGGEIEEEGGALTKTRRGSRKKERTTDFLAGLFRPILHKIITLLHPLRFLFRLHLALLPFSFPSSRFINI
jgi:hypothetical protein